MPLSLADTYRTLNEKQRRVLNSAVIFLLVFLISYNLIYKNAAKKVRYYNNKLQKATALNKLRGELYKLDGEKENREKLIIQKQDIDSIKNILSKLASNSGVRVVSVGSTRKAGPADYNVFSTKLELRCSYHQLGNFISKIENAEPYIGIRSVKLENAAMRLTIMRGGKPEPTTPLSKGHTVTTANMILETYSLRK